MAAESSVSQRNFPIGQGYGPAEINPAYLLSRIAGGGTITLDTLNYYAYLMQGYAYYIYSGTPPTGGLGYSIDGKYGESARVYANRLITRHQAISVFFRPQTITARRPTL